MEESVIIGEANCEGFDAAGAPASARVKCVNGEREFYDTAGDAAALPEDGAPAGGGGCAASPREEGGGVWGAIPWALSVQAEARVLRAQERLAAAAADFDLCVVSTRESPGYGKDFIKKCKVSPDAFVQAAMQLAYFRDTAATDGAGRCENTYESSMTRLFYHGRTETVRPLTAEMRAFVAAMQAPGVAPAEKLAALQAAAARHVGLYQDAMCGEGVDRHLFGLYCVSSALTRESPFLKGALSTPWKLSTSQQPQQQTNLWDIKDPAWADRISPGGGFGPVAADGYGVSYMTSGEREIFFHISARKTANGAPSRTDARRFQGLLFGALAEMKAVLSLALKKE
jgi:carnitine O-palmitoyltransferase 1